MSRFSNALTEVISLRSETATELAAKCDFSQSTISRLQRGTTKPDEATLDKLCTYLKKEEATKLLLAHVADSVPINFHKLVRFSSSDPKLIEEEPLPAVLQQLQSKTRTSILQLAQMCRDDEELADLIVRTVNKLKGG